MMLLAAVVLILAFLALSAMVSRVNQLASSTTQEQDRPILLEVGTLRKAVDDLIADLQAITPALNDTVGDPSDPSFNETIEAGLRHLVALESSRGLSMAFGATPGVFDGAVVPCDTTARVVWIRLSDGELTVEFATTETYTCA